MAEAFIVRRGGGGGSGGTLVVTSSGAGTVTVSNTVLGKSYSKSVTAGGSVTFKGLKTGEWTVTLSNGTQTATRSVTINADYSVSVAYFSATISVTYPATSTCVVTNSDGQTVASDTNTGSSTKTWTATVGATGTYTVTATATDGSGKTKSTTVSITADGQSKSVTLSYELYIFKSGTGMTSGYSAKFAAVAGGDTSNSISNNAITWATNAAQGGNMVISPAVDLSSYNTLHVELDYTGHYDGGRVTFGVGNSTMGSSFTASKEDTYNTSKHTITIDVSKITSELYIKSTSRQSAGRFYNIWLT